MGKFCFQSANDGSNLSHMKLSRKVLQKRPTGSTIGRGFLDGQMLIAFRPACAMSVSPAP